MAKTSLRYMQIALVLGLGASSLSGCKREATGQVIAVVNGEEITRQELNAKLQNANLPQDVDKNAIQQAALQQIVERKLLAKVARDAGVDKSGDYILQRQEMEEMLLIQLLGKQTDKTIKVPTIAESDKYIASHPWMFANRAILNMDRIQFAAKPDDQAVKALIPLHSMQDVAAKLNEMHVPFRRGTSQVDTALVPPQVLDRLMALPKGEPLGVPEAGIMNLSTIIDSKPAPLTGDEARPIAAKAMRAETMNAAFRAKLDEAKKAAKITYQNGFAPPIAPKKN